MDLPGTRLPASRLRFALVSEASAREGIPEPETVLLTVAYGGRVAGTWTALRPELAVPNRVLEGAAPLEVWRSRQAVERRQRDRLAWAEDGQLLAGAVDRPLTPDVATATHAHFTGILDLLEEHGYPHLLRVWNYLPAINEGEGDEETYRRFNAGRAWAFEERFGPELAPGRYPAASTVGTPGAALRTAFLACRETPTRVENPRQVRAYRYPTLYGPSSPSFSRATVAPPELGGALFLSGTASIAGHRTRHAGSVELQVAETLANLEAVRTAACRGTGRAIPRLAELDLVKVYLRHCEHKDAVRAALAGALRPETPTILLEADICRRDLLVEIEGFALAT